MITSIALKPLDTLIWQTYNFGLLKRNFTPTLLITFFLLIYLGYTLAQADGDVRVFATIGSGFENGVPVDNENEGYDGQFTYFIALDPNPENLTNNLDIPAYRYQRILYPMLARIFGLGQPNLIPWTLVLVNVLVHIIATALLEQWLIANKLSRWYALPYAFWAGLAMAVRSNLTEPLCYGLVVASFWAQQKNRHVWTAIFIGLALFTKETALFFLAAQVAAALFKKDWKRASMFASPLIPFGLFQLYLYRTFGEIGLTSGGFMATGFEFIPYMGLWRVAGINFTVFIVYCVLFLPMVILPNIWGILASIRRLLRRDFSPLVWSMAANAMIIPFTPFSTFREPFGMIRFMDGFVLATILFGAHIRSKRVLNYSLFWIAALAFVVNS